MPPTPTRILLVRHGQSTWNAAGRWQGHADVPLSELGEAQALAAAAGVGAIDALAASDLERARRTAEIIGEAIGVGPVAVFPGLRERHVGEFEGLTRAEIDERMPGALTGAPGRPITEPFVPPGGEATPAVASRAMATMHRIAESHPAGTVLAVTHGGLIRCVEHALGLEPEACPNLGGRAFTVGDGRIVPGERVLLIDPDAVELTIPKQQ